LLSTMDVVFYVGHSRNGGGPDFYPPHLTTAGLVEYPWYEKNAPGVPFLVQALNTRVQGKLQMLGLMSCSSQSHFLSAIKTAAGSKVGIISSLNLVGDNQMSGSTLGAIHGILQFSCPARLEKLMNPAHLTQGVQFEISGLFSPHIIPPEDMPVPAAKKKTTTTTKSSTSISPNSASADIVVEDILPLPPGVNLTILTSAPYPYEAADRARGKNDTFHDEDTEAETSTTVATPVVSPIKVIPNPSELSFDMDFAPDTPKEQLHQQRHQELQGLVPVEADVDVQVEFQ